MDKLKPIVKDWK